MSTSLQLVPANENAARRRAAAIEQHLSRFRAELQPRVRAIAAVHPWAADLAVSFPALAIALAVPRHGVDRAAGLRMAIAGAPLPALAKHLRTPLWLRAFPPGAFDKAAPILPDDGEFRRRIVNHFPTDWKLAPRWLELIALASDVADGDVALWFAREAPLRMRRPRYVRQPPQRPPYARLVALFAWVSKRRVAGIAGGWNGDMQWKAALAAALDWRDASVLKLHLGENGVADAWFEPGSARGFDFVPLRSVEEVDAEAAAMRNCVRNYGADLASNYAKLWSVRRDGERVATLSLTAANGFLPGIQELAGPANARVDKDVWLAAHAWLAGQNIAAFDESRFAYSRTACDQRAWRAMWRSYWLNKRRIPAWLPLKGDEATLCAL